MKHILKCSKCSKYTMKEECCGESTLNPKPMKFGLEDKYGRYRREKKQREWKEKGLN